MYVRYRIRFGKVGSLRYTSHLDVARIWERTLRRAGAPVVYSQGFNPRPKMQLAAALPLGYTSDCEIIDVWMEQGSTPPPVDLLASLREKAPQGLIVDEIWEVDPRGPALQTVTRRATYTAQLPESGLSAVDLRERAESVLSQEEIWVEGRKRRKNIRPLLHRIDVLDDASLVIETTLSQDAGTLRPDNVMEHMGLDPLAARIHRTTLHYAEPIS